MDPLIPRTLLGSSEPVVVTGLLVVLALACLGLSCLALNRHRALRRLQAVERSFRDLYDNITEGVFRSTLDGTLISANPALVRLNEFDSEDEMLAAVNDIGGKWYVDPERREEIYRLLLKHGKVTKLVSEVHRYKSRERIWIEENTRLVRDAKTGEPLYYDGTVREVTEKMRRLQLQERYDKIASIVSGCLMQHRRKPDGASSIPYASIGLFHIFGLMPRGGDRGQRAAPGAYSSPTM
jgi:PAS domain S-box-containing protein